MPGEKTGLTLVKPETAMVDRGAGAGLDERLRVRGGGGAGPVDLSASNSEPR